jgi:hypothetical protein
LLSNPDALPIRRIKANGGRSNPFSIHCGVPQGCPLSPLAFLVIAEALTRLIVNDSTVKGIEINGTNIKISQFADDTQIFAESYEEITNALRWVERYERATGSKVNAHKYVGIKWGTQKDKPTPSTFTHFKSSLLVDRRERFFLGSALSKNKTPHCKLETTQRPLDSRTSYISQLYDILSTKILGSNHGGPRVVP